MASLVTVGHDTNPARRLRKKQGARLREIRTQFRNLTLEQVAERMRELPDIEITQQAISQWENGVSTPRPHLRVAICRVLDVPPSSIWNLDAEVA